jgi:hypothetical protein
MISRFGERPRPAFFMALGVMLVPRALFAEGRDHESEAQAERAVIVGVGGATELELGDGSLHPGANVMIEWDAIEDWLELEIGASVLAAEGGVEVPIDLLVKKPFKLAQRAEFMVGVGPEIVRVTGTNRGTYFGGELAFDFMFWPWGRHIGLWLEPEYDVIFVAGHPSSGTGATGGVLFGW